MSLSKMQLAACQSGRNSPLTVGYDIQAANKVEQNKHQVPESTLVHGLKRVLNFVVGALCTMYTTNLTVVTRFREHYLRLRYRT
jgi:hypothetical protein